MKKLDGWVRERTEREGDMDYTLLVEGVEMGHVRERTEMVTWRYRDEWGDWSRLTEAATVRGAKKLVSQAVSDCHCIDL